jgi:uncharacterized Zn finger protein
MPYLEFVKCDKCGESLDVDHGATIRAYHEDGRREQDNFINPATIIWDYLVYTCYRCNTFQRLTFRDIEKKVRVYFSDQSERFRTHFDQLDAIDFDEMGRVISEPTTGRKKETVKRLDRIYTKK